jgi:Tol biopolymer transport system component
MADLSYLDFDLLIERSGTRYRARVLNSPSGEASGTFELPFSREQLQIFVLKAIGLGSRRRVRRLESPEMTEIKTFGRNLFQAVFDGELSTCLRRSIDEADRRHAGLRIRLRLDDAGDDAGVPLLDVPWEFLYDPGGVGFLCLSSASPIVRYPDLPRPIQPLAVAPPIRLLVMISSPKDAPRLDVEHEGAKLEEALRVPIQRGLITVDRLEVATLQQLQRQLRTSEYHVFHFIGHGGYDERGEEGVLLLEDERGRSDPASAEFLRTLFQNHRTLRLAILNACEGARTDPTDPFAGVAQSLVRGGVSAVIAMQFEISDEAAIMLSSEFYSALADGYPVDAALAEARTAVYTRVSAVEWAVPVLYLRSPDGSIFDVAAPPISEPVLLPPPDTIEREEPLLPGGIEPREQLPDTAEPVEPVVSLPPETGEPVVVPEPVEVTAARAGSNAAPSLRARHDRTPEQRTAEPVTVPPSEEWVRPSERPPSPRRRRLISILAVLLGLVVVGTVVIVAIVGGDEPPPPPPPPPAKPLQGWIVYVREGAIWKLDPGAGTERQVLSAAEANAEPLAPSVSPDGRKILFGGAPDGGRADVFVVEWDGSGLVNLTETPSLTEGSPDWSPDGSEIAYERASVEGASDIYVMNEDGSNEQPLFAGAGNDLRPEWSPDDTRVAFQSDRYGKPDVFVFHLDDGSVDRLTHDIESDDGAPEWSPNGERILFKSDRRGSPEVWLMNANGDNEHPVRENVVPETVRAPGWSPDGIDIIYARETSSGSDLYKIDAEGGTPLPLTYDGNSGAPTWCCPAREPEVLG